MNLFTKFLEALGSSRQQEANRVIRRYRYLAEQARAYDEKNKLEAADENAWGAPSHPLFLGGKPLFTP
jgi:hypothetical protein